MSDEIRKSFSGAPIKADAKADIDLINRYTLKDLKPEKVFAFRMKGRSAVQFAEYAEKYLLYRLGGTFPALNIYKEMTATG